MRSSNSTQLCQSLRLFTAVLTLDLKTSVIEDFGSQNSKLENRWCRWPSYL